MRACVLPYRDPVLHYRDAVDSSSIRQVAAGPSKAHSEVAVPGAAVAEAPVPDPASFVVLLVFGLPLVSAFPLASFLTCLSDP